MLVARLVAILLVSLVVRLLIYLDSSSSAALRITIIVANRIRTVVVRFSEESDICPISITSLSTSYSSEGFTSYTFN